jgi:hypothetical protein
MSADRISHVLIETSKEDDSKLCANIKSRKEPKKRCVNLATHGEFCGIHFKHPRPWCPGSPASIAARVKSNKRGTKTYGITEIQTVNKLVKWWKLLNGLRQWRLRGPAFWARTICTNDSDFFSTESLTDISGSSFFSYKDGDNHVYGFDIRSINTLLYRARVAGEVANNPFTRTPFPSHISKQVQKLVRWMTRHKLPTEWAPLTPPTPEQQIRMKIVDVFSKIDELNYYSSPDWFLELSEEGHRRFYSQLFDIWTHRANLTMAQKNTIVPGFGSRLFKTPRWALVDLNLEGLQRLNLNVIRMMIGSATDRNDRIIGAMYVVSTLTLVCERARTAYPWLYESVVEEPPAPQIPDPRRPVLANLVGVGWLQEILAMREVVEGRGIPAPEIPLLELPPPADGEQNAPNS